MKAVVAICLALVLAVNAVPPAFFGCTLAPVSGVTTSGTGSVACYADHFDSTSSMACAVRYSGLTSAATLAHWHVGIASTVAGNVTFVFATPSGTSGNQLSSANHWTDTSTTWHPQPVDAPITFSAQVSSCASGGCYFNLHTVNHPAGELRCQAAGFDFTDATSGPLAVPPNPTVASTATGSYSVVKGASVDGTRAWGYTVSWTGVTSVVTASHIHEAAGPLNTDTGGVRVVFDITGSALAIASGTFSGVALLCNTDYAAYVNRTALLDAFTYVNVHTGMNPGGEIRGNFGFMTITTADPAVTCTTGTAGAMQTAPIMFLIFALVAIVKVFM